MEEEKVVNEEVKEEEVKDDEIEEEEIVEDINEESELDLLKKEIAKKVLDNSNLETDFTTNIRQQNCLEQAKNALLTALEATNNYIEQDLISIDIKTALLFLDEISGEVMNDDILNNIFENFCIGK